MPGSAAGGGGGARRGGALVSGSVPGRGARAHQLPRTTSSGWRAGRSNTWLAFWPASRSTCAVSRVHAVDLRPLYTTSAAPVAKLFGLRLVSLRMVSFAASVGVLRADRGAVPRAHAQPAGRAGRRRALRGAVQASGAFFDLARVDSLALFFMLLACVGAAPSERHDVAAGVLLAAAFFTKQSVLLDAGAGRRGPVDGAGAAARLPRTAAFVRRRWAAALSYTCARRAGRPITCLCCRVPYLGDPAPGLGYSACLTCSWWCRSPCWHWRS